MPSKFWNSSYRALSSTPQPRLPTQRVELFSESSPSDLFFLAEASAASGSSSAFLFLEGFSATAGFSSSSSSSDESELSEPDSLESLSSSSSD